MLLLPGEKNTPIGRNKEALLLKIDRDEFQVLNQKNESLLHENQSIANDDDSLKNIFEQAAASDGVALNIQIENTEVLMRKVTLPANTEENLYEVIQYEMDRYTPFNKEDVYFDYLIEERNSEKQILKVLLIVIRKEILSSVVNAIEKTNVHLRSIEIIDSEVAENNLKEINFFRTNNEISKSKKASNKWLLTIAAGLLVLTGLTPIVMNYIQISNLSSELKSLEGTVIKVKQLQNEYQKMQEQVGYLVSIKDRNPSIIEMLNLLTKVIPDHTYVQRLSLESGQLSMQGVSASASELIGIIDQTGLFDDIRFAAPVTQSGGDGLERYSITANIKSKTLAENSQST
ncbi:MAG: PilN domain-containing protein [Pseudomonadota bacterium]